MFPSLRVTMEWLAWWCAQSLWWSSSSPASSSPTTRGFIPGSTCSQVTNSARTKKSSQTFNPYSSLQKHNKPWPSRGGVRNNIEAVGSGRARKYSEHWRISRHLWWTFCLTWHWAVIDIYRYIVFYITILWKKNLVNISILFLSWLETLISNCLETAFLYIYVTKFWQLSHWFWL